MMGNINVREIPENLKHEFKTWCAKNRVTMQDSIIALMEMAMERNLNVKLIISKRKKGNGKPHRNSKST